MPADKRQLPVARLVDDVAGNERRDDGRQRRSGVHEPAGEARVARRDVHRDRPHRPDRELGEEERRCSSDSTMIVRSCTIRHRHHEDESTPESRTTMMLRRALRPARRVRSKMRSLTMPPRKSPHDAGEEDRRREQRRAAQIQLVAVQEVRRNPGEEEPQRPAVAEVDERDGQHPRGQRAPTARAPTALRALRSAAASRSSARDAADAPPGSSRK